MPPEKPQNAAESRWLEEFAAAAASSLGAAFRDEAYDSGEDDGEPLEVKYAAGNRVRYAHPDYGYPGEQEHAAARLVVGEVYTIAWADIGRSKTELQLTLAGASVGRFNSVLFEPAPDPSPTAVPAEPRED